MGEARMVATAIKRYNDSKHTHVGSIKTRLKVFVVVPCRCGHHGCALHCLLTLSSVMTPKFVAEAPIVAESLVPSVKVYEEGSATPVRMTEAARVPVSTSDTTRHDIEQNLQ